MSTLPDPIGHRLFKEVADRSFDAITITRSVGDDAPLEIVYVNEAFTEMTGYETEEVIGETPGMLQGPETDPEVLDRLDRKMQRGDPFHGETVNYRKDGSAFIIEWKVVPVEQEGDTTYHVAVQRDVTDRRETAEASA